MRLRRGLTALLLIIIMLLTAGCENLPWDLINPPEDGTKGSVSPEDITAFVEICIKDGDYFSELMMDESAAFYYGYAMATASSCRLAVERILWLRGEGDSFAEVSAGSRYTDFDQIAEICCACPYPIYFKGLIHEIRGQTEEAKECRDWLETYINYPEEGIDCMFLRDLPIESLYTLRDTLRAVEDKIYEKYEPELWGLGGDPRNGIPEYLIATIMTDLKEENYRHALSLSRELIRMAPLNAENWVLAVTSAVSADEGMQAVLWLREGLLYHPEDEILVEMGKAFSELVKEVKE